MQNLTVGAQFRKPEKNTGLIAWHWYDFTCPFCYVAGSRNQMLTENGFNVIALPLQAHPEVPAGGIPMGERRGPMYEALQIEAVHARLTLNWPARLPNSRYALALAEQVRRHLPRIFPDVKNRLYAAHFVLNEDLGSAQVVNSCLHEFGIEDWEINRWLEGGAAFVDLERSQHSARRAGVAGTPAWVLDDQLIFGLQSRSYFREVIRSTGP